MKSEMFLEIHTFSFTKMHLKMSFAKWRYFFIGPNVLNSLNVLHDRCLDYVEGAWPELVFVA